jgi:hypothetical protein
MYRDAYHQTYEANTHQILHFMVYFIAAHAWKAQLLAADSEIGPWIKTLFNAWTPQTAMQATDYQLKLLFHSGIIDGCN